MRIIGACIHGEENNSIIIHVRQSSSSMCAWFTASPWSIIIIHVRLVHCNPVINHHHRSSSSSS
eukprot:NODE_3555_length_770_cov_2.600000.p5 GENE.NODE_3555_length_770_cov_2.600000~~NODE_3555_length_770_cov_2.600000.p5  ORF type:complete len:64 (-),score=19.47 NODE_3555_length_770_cov_2.600000:74-265(-)